MNVKLNAKLACATLAVGMLAGAAAPAVAADMISAGPGVKYVPNGVAVPVPAPMPVENYPARWYFRVDAALGIRGTDAFHEKGLVFGEPVATGGSGTFRSRPGWFSGNDDLYAGFGVGVGYRFSPFLRGDITVETRGERKFGATPHSYSYTTNSGATTVNGNYIEDSSLTSIPVMFNLYWDFARKWGGFRPYLGAGLGFAINELNRTVKISESTGGDPSASLHEKTHDVSLAAMFTAGLGYEVDPSWALDFNYRMLYVGGSDVSVSGASRNSTAFFGEQLDHQFRAGVRFNVY